MGTDGSTINVSHLGGAEFSVGIRGHELVVDQPRTAGGEDAGPTPTELFVASLAACVAFYGRSFLHRRGLPDTVSVSARWGMALRPASVGRITLRIEAPGVPADRQDAFRRAIEHCTVHNTLLARPEISFEVIPAGEPGIAASWAE